MKAGEYLFVITLEQAVVGFSPAQLSSMGIIEVTDETLLESDVETDLTRMSRCKIRTQLIEQGYILSEDEPKTISFLLKPQ
jgi:hypothetical protein